MFKLFLVIHLWKLNHLLSVLCMYKVYVCTKIIYVCTKFGLFLNILSWCAFSSSCSVFWFIIISHRHLRFLLKGINFFVGFQTPNLSYYCTWNDLWEDLTMIINKSFLLKNLISITHFRFKGIQHQNLQTFPSSCIFYVLF